MGCPLYDLQVADPWKKIRNDMFDIKEKMGESLLSLFEAYVQCEHTDGLLQKQILTTIQDNGTMVAHSFKDELTNLTYFDSWQRWIVYGFLACPAQLSMAVSVKDTRQAGGASPLGLDLLKIAGKDGFMVDQFRSQTFNFHEQYELFFDKADKKWLKEFGKEYTGKNAPGKLIGQFHKDAISHWPVDFVSSPDLFSCAADSFWCRPLSAPLPS